MNTNEPREETILEQALSFDSIEARHAYLRGACGNDEQLRARVESLIKAHEAAGGFLRDKTTQASPTVGMERPSVEGPGTVIGRYKLLEQIGEGGFGIVWMAEQDEPVRRRLALKIIKLGMDTRQVVARFEAERQALAMMDHPNIARVFDGGATESGRPYFVMELVRGMPITKFCDEHRLSTKDRLELFVQVCHAVQHAHQKGIIHRDLKSSNILVGIQDDRPLVKVIDFGVAKATEARLTEKTLFTRFQQIIGTPAYMSPEQAGMGGLDIDTRSDIYSLGVLLYELLTGRPPFEAKKLLEKGYDAMLRVIREVDPPKPSTRLSTLTIEELREIASRRSAEPQKLNRVVRGELDWIVMKALEKDRARRYETALAFAHDIERFVRNEPVSAVAPSLSYQFSKFARRNRVALGTASLFLLVLVAAAVVSIWQAVRATRHARESRRLADESRERLARLNIANGVRVLDEGNTQDALLWFAQAATLSPEDRINRLRFGSCFRYAPRLIQLFAHRGPVEYGEFSPDATRVVTASDDHTAQVWDATTGVPISSPLEHNDVVTRAVFSPDGRKIATASFDKTARIWDATTGQPLTAPLKHNEKLLAGLSFSPDGRRLATGSSDGFVRVWDVDTGKEVLPALEQSGDVRVATFSPNGKHILTASFDKTARLWDVQTGKLKSPPLKDTGRVYWAAFSPDGSRIVTASPDNVGRVWDVASGEPVTPPLEHQSHVFWCAFSPDGQMVATASLDSTARIWNASTGEAITPPLRHAKATSWVTFSPDSRSLITASLDKTVRLWDILNPEPLVAILNHNDESDSAVFRADGQRLLTTSLDGAAQLWDLTALEPRHPSLQHQREILDFAVSPNGTRIATASRDGTARIWDAITSEPVTETLRHRGDVARVAFSRDGGRVITASFDESARVWDAVSGQPIGPPLRHSREVMDASFSPDGARAATAGADHEVLVWKLPSGQRALPPIKHDSRIMHVSFSADGQRLLTYSLDNTARVWDALTGEPVTPPLRHKARINSAVFNSDARRILTTSDDLTARLWDASSGATVGPPFQHTRQVIFATFSPDGREVVTTSADGTAQLWSSNTGKPMGPPLKHNFMVWHAAFSHDGRLIATASFDRTARVWDAITGQPITPPLRHGNWVRRVAFTPDDRQLITAAGQRVEFWDLVKDERPARELVRLAETVAVRALNVSGAVSPLPAEDAVQRLRQLRGSHPEDFSTSPQASMAWQRRQAELSEQAGRWFGAASHWDRIASLIPNDATATARGNTARALAAKATTNMAGSSPQKVPLAKKIPALGGGAAAGMIDLSAYYNAALTDGWHSEKGEPGNHLADLPNGIQTFAGVDFDVRGIIQLSHNALSGVGFPEHVKGIKIGRRCRRLHFLHAAGWEATEGTKIASYLLHYANGQSRELPVLFGREVRGWWCFAAQRLDALEAAESVVAWTGTNPTARAMGVTLRLFKTTWDNPLAEEEIQTIDFLTTEIPTAPFLIAISAD